MSALIADNETAVKRQQGCLRPVGKVELAVRAVTAGLATVTIRPEGRDTVLAGLSGTGLGRGLAGGTPRDRPVGAKIGCLADLLLLP